MTYWEQRQNQLRQALEKDEANLKKRLSSFFDSEYKKLDKEIAAYYQQYSVDNVIEYRQLMQRLSSEDVKLLMEQMDMFVAKYPQWAHLMPVRESVYRLNRLEGLQYSVKMQQLQIGAVTNTELQKHLERQATRGLDFGADVMGFGKSFYANNPQIINLFVNVPWLNGKNFSHRIWDNTDKLSNYLATDIAQGLARGDSYQRLIKQLRQRFGNVSRNDAYRLIYTEGTYVMAESSVHAFKDDFEQYRISTVGDGKVCSICSSISEQVFSIADRVPGTNFPPFHSWCRCSYTIEVEDWDKWMDEYAKKYNQQQAEAVAQNFGTYNTPEFVRMRTYKQMNLTQKQFLKNELKSIPPSHRTLARPAINDIIFTKDGVSHYDRKKKIVYILDNPEKGELIHEIAHALETEIDLWRDKEFMGIVTGVVKDKTYSDIVNLESYGENIDFIKSEKFVSDYQGRIYKSAGYVLDDYIHVNPKALGEYFTEGYKEYVLNPNKLQNKDKVLYDYIKRRLG